jgi:hypothetical protein
MTIGRVSGFAIFQGQRNLEWLYVKNTPMTLLLTTLPSHMLYMAAAGVHFARGGALLTFVRAKLAAVVGLPRALRKRWRVQRTRRVDAAALRSLMDTQWLSTKLREKRFDAELAGGRR